MKKKIISLLLALAMVLSLVACGGNNDNNSTNDNSGNQTQDNNTNDSNTNDTDAPSDGGYTGLDWDAIDAMDWEDSSLAVYDWNLGEFADVYANAKAEVVDLDHRMALMAISEAKLLESGVFFPIQTQGGNYAMSRVVPRTITTTAWGLDEYRYGTMLIANELLLPSDRVALTTLWSEAETAADYFAAARSYLDEHGYTLRDDYSTSTSWTLKTWDVLATSQTSDSYYIAGTFSGLMEYDAKNMLQPALAESYEVSADALTYTFHIRQGVNWVDQQGSVIGEVTADDWVAGAMHLADNSSALGYLLGSSDGCGVKNWDAYLRGEATFEEVGVKALDKYTLEYTLEAPFPPFITMMGYACFAPLNRDFYKAQGGTFGAEGDEYTAGNYGKTPANIAYNGAYLITNYTENVITSYVTNPSYWNADTVTAKTVNIYVNDGSDPTRSYEEGKSGVIVGCGITSSTLELAKAEKPEGQDGTYFDTYAYVAAASGSSYGGWYNLNRQSFANYDDATKGISPQTPEDAARTRQAMNNQHFRLALAFGMDRGAFLAPSVGDELKYASMRNTYTPSDFQFLTGSTTVEINGVSQSFPAGTAFGEIVQAQLDADGIPIKVWDPNGNDGAGSGDGFDGWYSVANCNTQLDLAIAELAEIGVEISAANPIYIDMPYSTYSQIRTNQLNALKQSLENSTGGKVIVNLIGFDDQDSFAAAYYRIGAGYDANYDIEPYAGWGPDYGDAQTYLDTIQAYGYMCKNIGLFGE